MVFSTRFSPQSVITVPWREHRSVSKTRAHDVLRFEEAEIKTKTKSEDLSCTKENETAKTEVFLRFFTNMQ